MFSNTEAIILAGGFGTRLQSVVRDLPKPMAPVAGKPFLAYLLNHLQSFGVEKAVLSTGYLHEKVSDYFGDHFEGITLDYSVEMEPLGTGGGIRKAIGLCKGSEVLVLNGDSFFDIDLYSFFRLHREHQAMVSLAIRSIGDAARYGTILLNAESGITAFREKNGLHDPGLINAGVYLLHRETFLKHTPAKIPFSIEKDFFEKKVATLGFKGFIFDAYFIDIGIPEDYKKEDLRRRDKE